MPMSSNIEWIASQIGCSLPVGLGMSTSATAMSVTRAGSMVSTIWAI